MVYGLRRPTSLQQQIYNPDLLSTLFSTLFFGRESRVRTKSVTSRSSGWFWQVAYSARSRTIRFGRRVISGRGCPLPRLIMGPSIHRNRIEIIRVMLDAVHWGLPKSSQCSLLDLCQVLLAEIFDQKLFLSKCGYFEAQRRASSVKTFSSPKTCQDYPHYTLQLAELWLEFSMKSLHWRQTLKLDGSEAKPTCHRIKSAAFSLFLCLV